MTLIAVHFKKCIKYIPTAFRQNDMSQRIEPACHFCIAKQFSLDFFMF